MKKLIKRKITAQQLFDTLTRERIKEKSGHLQFVFGNIDFVIKDRKIVGTAIQNWIGEWFERNNIAYAVKPNSQDYPDFYLDPDGKTKALLEIKTFDADRSANFDIANFEAYCRSLKTDAYRLDADYLILSYKMDKDGTITIQNIWLKKVWQISGSSGEYPVKVQQKQNAIYNIRPITWYGSSSATPSFGTRLGFVKALHKTLIQYKKTQAASAGWLKDVKKDYKRHTKNKL